MGFDSDHDAPAPMGTPIYAVADGVAKFKVTVSPDNQFVSYGNWVELDFGDGTAKYAHLSKFPGQNNYKANGSIQRKYQNGDVTKTLYTQNVKKGDIIGYTGSTGNSTGPHLHFEMTVNGKKIDPREYF